MSSSNSVEMPFLDHLEELRWRLFKCAVAIALGVGVAFALLYTKQVDIIAFLSQPIQPYLKQPLRYRDGRLDYARADRRVASVGLANLGVSLPGAVRT
jgi:Sec-independent protein secretion pathway component TatC